MSIFWKFQTDHFNVSAEWCKVRKLKKINPVFLESSRDAKFLDARAFNLGSNGATGRDNLADKGERVFVEGGREWGAALQMQNLSDA